MELIETSPFIRFAGEAVVPKRKENALCLDCRLMLILKGQGKININGKNHDFFEGTLLFWQGQTSYRFIFKNAVKALVLDFDLFSNGKNQSQIIPLVPTAQGSPLKTVTFCDSAVLNSPLVLENGLFVKDRIIKIINEFKKQTPLSHTNASAYLKLCLSKICEGVIANSEPGGTAENIEFLTDYIQKNYSLPLTNDHLAALVGYHPYYLNRIFKQTTGSTIHQYILTHRLSAAAQLLISTYHPIAQIGEEVGFNNQISFINAFKKAYHLTPTEFRKRTL